MRILHVINHGTTRGGAERLTADLAGQQRQVGHDVHVLAGDLPGGGERFADSRWPAHEAGLVGRVLTHYRNSAARDTLRDLVSRWRPDVVHLHTVGLLSPLALPVLRNVPTVMTLHGPELFLRGTVRRCLPAHYFVYGSRTNRLTVPGALAAVWAAGVTGTVWRRLLRRNVDVFVAPSRFLAGLSERSLGPTRVVGNGVHEAYLAAIRPPAPPAAGPRLVMAGRLEDFKGPQVLLAALPAILARHPGTRLRILGTGPLAGVLPVMAAELGVGHAVTMAGWLSPAELAAELSRSDVAVVPSLWPEAFGMTALEALAAGCPVIAAATGALPEVVRHERTGLVVPPGNPDALAAAVDRLLTDADLRSRLARAGRDLAEEFTLPSLARALDDVYREARARAAGRMAPGSSATPSALHGSLPTTTGGDAR